MQKLESSQGTGYGLMIISIFISGSDTSALVSSSNVSYHYAITAAVLVDHSNKMENTTSRLAIQIQNYPPYEVDWADNSAQKARCDLEEKDILPNDEDGQQLYDHMLKFVMSFLVKKLESLSDLCQFLPSAVERSTCKSEIVPLMLLFRDEKSIDENIQILVQYTKDAELDGSPQVCTL